MHNAQYYLGYCYEHGEGVKVNKKKANHWYLESEKEEILIQIIIRNKLRQKRIGMVSSFNP